MNKAGQRKRILKARVAVAMYDHYGRVPSEQAVETTYRLVRLLDKAVRGSHAMSTVHKGMGSSCCSRCHAHLWSASGGILARASCQVRPGSSS